MPPSVFSSVWGTNIAIKIISELIHESSQENLLGVILDKNLSFKAHVTSLYRKANKNAGCSRMDSAAKT